MRKFLSAAILLLSSVLAFAQSDNIETNSSHFEYVTGSGRYSTFCSGTDYFCLDNVKRYSQADAIRQAEFSCHLKSGQTDSFSATCNDFCTPSYIPPGSESQMVSCQSTCTVRCDISNPNSTEENE